MKKFFAFAIAALAALAVALAGGPSTEANTIYQTGGDAAESLSNLSDTLEDLIDPIVQLAVIVVVISVVMGLVGRIRGWFKM